jgi:hypothetical protein
MITAAPWQAWIGFEAFYVSLGGGPCYLIQVERKEMARRLRAGETLSQIVTGEATS